MLPASGSVDVMLALENELHRARLAIIQLEAQRDFLLNRVVELEGNAWDVSLEAPSNQHHVQQPDFRRLSSGGPPAKKRGRPPASRNAASAVSDSPVAVLEGDRTGLCVAALNKSGKLCRRRATTNFAYCGYHLPLDPASGFMYCTHIRPGGKSCGNPVPVNSDRLCKYHKVGAPLLQSPDESDSGSMSE
jgi:hypothetical protein